MQKIEPIYSAKKGNGKLLKQFTRRLNKVGFNCNEKKDYVFISLFLYFLVLPYLSLLKKHVILLSFILFISFANAQQIIPIQVKMKGGGFSLDSTSFSIVQTIDQRKNQEGIGTVYGGILNMGFPAIVKKGVEDAYGRFFYKGLKNTVKGEKQLVISFKDLVYTHDDLEAKKDKKIRLEIEIDYYENNSGKLIFLFTDKNSTIINSKYNQKQLSNYSYTFFKSSLKKVDLFLTSEKYKQKVTPKPQTFSVENNSSDSLNNTKIIQSNKPKDQLSSLDSLPEQFTRPKNHHLITFEKFEGSNTSGFRFRYTGFAREWDDFTWKPALSIDIEGFRLNKDVGNFNIYYSYFALGIGAIKPLNNYFFLDLNAKIAIGNEIIDGGLFVEQERNTMFGILLTQRIHFMVGKGAGLVLTGGIYQNLFSGAQYLSGDVGVLFGGGIKF